MTALRKTDIAATTPETDMFSGAGTALFPSGSAPSLDGVETGLFPSGSAPEASSDIKDGALTGLFPSGS